MNSLDEFIRQITFRGVECARSGTHVFKTARFKVHNPSRHKKAVLWYALEQYHLTLKRVLETVLADPELATNIFVPDRKGKLRLNRYATERVVRLATPKGWSLAPLRDYLIVDAGAMLLSHFGKLEKAKHESNPPTMPSLEPMTEREYLDAYREFTSENEFPIKPEHQDKIEEAAAQGHTRVAERLQQIYGGWSVSRYAGQLLRRLEGSLPRPLEFRHTEFERGCVLARKGDDYYALIRLFSEGHRYREHKVLADGMVDCRTGEDLSGRKYPGVILPLEFGRDFHEREYLEHGKPQSAKLVVKRKDDGELEFYIHIAFEFTPESVVTETILGIDRGAAKLGSATVVNMEGATLLRGLDVSGAAFTDEMARLRRRIAQLQKKGYRQGRVFRLRGRKADIIIGEYANRIVEKALEHKAQIVIEKINATSMALFLSQSQFTKLKDKLEYKAARAGLPEPIEVPAAYTSQTCARCGHRAPENRPKKDDAGKTLQDVFRCVACGYEANADDNASEIIALRAVHQIQQGGKFQKFEVFNKWLKTLSGRECNRAFGAAAR